MTCSFPTCPGKVIPHDMHLMSEPGGPFPMRVTPDRKAVYLWLPDGTLLKERQPDAIHRLRARVQALAVTP